MEKRIFDIIQVGKLKDIPSRIFDCFIVFVILLSCLMAVFDTYEELARYRSLLHNIELIIAVIFTIELALRLWTARYIFTDSSRFSAACRYMISFNGIIEILTILSAFLPSVFPTGIVLFRMIRVVRILRLLQLSSNIDAFAAIVTVLKNKRDKLISSVIMLFILMFASSLIMYHFENAVQPESFANAFSGLWWATSTIFTIGYGDIYPITVGGRMMSILITFIGVGVIAIPTGILAAGFTEYSDGKKAAFKYCPKCGGKIE